MNPHDSTLPPPPAAAKQADLREAIATLLEDWSLEATRANVEDIKALQSRQLPGSRVYLTALPGVAWQQLATTARRVAQAGLEPVPHLAVRNYDSMAQVAAFLGALREQGLRRVLVIAGDRDVPQGPFASSLELIESGLLGRAGIRAIDVAGYPEGHAKLSHADLSQALRAKVQAAGRLGLEVEVVTQFSFDAKTLLAWLNQLRYEFPRLPVRVGLAGPADASTLLRFAVRCGVRATVRGLGQGLRLMGNLHAERTPLRMIRALAEGWVLQGRSDLSLHFYTFGGLAKTAAWVTALQRGEVDLDEPDRP
ncbi:MAG TPA: methylenetetrahydrofolate reductase [bacterium]|nr:methylenetetrahydrofolate reductase [bacterium]